MRTDFLYRMRKRAARRFSEMESVWSVPVSIGGHKFIVPVVEGAHSDVSEPWMVELLSMLLPIRPGLFVDVGMNVGQTLLIVKAIDDSRGYVGFEPNPQCFAYCERVVRTNNLAGTTLVPVGLSSRTGIVKLQLYSSSGVDQAASMIERFRPWKTVKSEKYIPVYSFSDVDAVLRLGPIGLIKIDVEGAEWEVISTMSQALIQSRPWIVIEILPCYHRENIDRIRSQDSVLRFLNDISYALLRILKSDQGGICGIEKIATIQIHDDLKLCDYLCCPVEDEALIRSVLPI